VGLILFFLQTTKINAEKSNSYSVQYLTEPQDGRGWKGPLEGISSNPPAEAGSPRAGDLQLKYVNWQGVACFDYSSTVQTLVHQFGSDCSDSDPGHFNPFQQKPRLCFFVFRNLPDQLNVKLNVV